MLSVNSPLKRKYFNVLLRFMNLHWNGVRIAKGSTLANRVEIGTGTGITGPILMKGSGTIRIGKYGAFGEFIDLISSNHETCFPNLQFTLQQKITNHPIIGEKKGIEIGHNVWIGDHALILPGVHLGNGCIIGGGAVVTKSVPAYQISAGNPAKIIGHRFPETIIEILESVKWWDWPPDRIMRNKTFFELNLKQCDPMDILKILKE